MVRVARGHLEPGMSHLVEISTVAISRGYHARVCRKYFQSSLTEAIEASNTRTNIRPMANSACAIMASNRECCSAQPVPLVEESVLNWQVTFMTPFHLHTQTTDHISANCQSWPSSISSTCSARRRHPYSMLHYSSL